MFTKVTPGVLFLLVCLFSHVESLRIPKTAKHFTFQLSKPYVLKSKLSTKTDSNSLFYMDKHIVFPQESIPIHKVDYNSSLKRSLSIASSSIALFLVSCLVESNSVLASGEEAVQLLYGYHTNIPSALTWAVLLYGAYKTYFTVFRWLASW